jgi:hypothetical protein
MLLLPTTRSEICLGYSFVTSKSLQGVIADDYTSWGQGMTGPSIWKDAERVHPSLKGVKIVSRPHFHVTDFRSLMSPISYSPIRLSGQAEQMLTMLI